MLEVVGWIGSFCLSICGAPQAYSSLKNKHSEGISLSFILLWLVGEIFTLIYIIPKKDIPLIVNYSLNLLFIFLVLWYKLYPKREVKC
jgi:uncharacterized protein with PQ loop repeat